MRRLSCLALLAAATAAIIALPVNAQQMVEFEWHDRGLDWELRLSELQDIHNGRIVLGISPDIESASLRIHPVSITLSERTEHLLTIEFESLATTDRRGILLVHGERGHYSPPALLEATFNDSTLVGVVPEPPFGLAGAAPNPFNPTTTISYSIPAAGYVSMTVYDALGQHVRTLIEGELRYEGHHELQWDGTDDHGRHASSGLYLFRIQWRSSSSSASWTTAVRALMVK